ncbi:MAG: purine-nucleoside phosphorylase [Bacteroidota bacterium]
MELFDRIQEAVEYIQNRAKFQPKHGIVLGTGLSNLTDEIDVVWSIPYGEIPHFPVSTVQSHKGQLVFGHLAGEPVVAMAGRFHYYEGYSMEQVTFPIRVMKFLGIDRLVISNAAGGIQAHLHAGDLVFIHDHINLQPENPLRGANDERLGPRFPDMLKTYDPKMLSKAIETAEALGIPAYPGVYVGLQGPNLETPAEYEYMHRIGGDVVGMSTVPEVIVARHMDVPVFVVSVVTNRCYPIHEITETTVDEVIQVAQSSESKVTAIVKALIQAFQ